MGLHLASGALNQAALARDRARGAAVCWLLAAVVFVAWMLTPAVAEQLLRTEIGYAGATAPAGAAAVRALPPGLAADPAATPLSPAPHRARDRAGRPRRGRARRRSPSRRRTRSRRPRGSAGAVLGSMPPSTSHRHAVADDRRARARACPASAAMNGCPPQPGLTVMHSARSIAPATSASAPDGRAGLIATPTPAPRSRIRLAA